jgi:hypothetical protein
MRELISRFLSYNNAGYLLTISKDAWTELFVARKYGKILEILEGRVTVSSLATV